VPPGAQAIWWDEFSGDTLNTDLWSYDIGNGDWGWGNNELEVRALPAACLEAAAG
jgi:hypothetical protein